MRQVGWFCEHRYGTPTADTHMEWDHRKGKAVRNKNTVAALSYLRTADDFRCPHAVPILVAVPTQEAAA